MDFFLFGYKSCRFDITPTGLGELDFGLGLDNVVNVTNIATPENNASQSAIPDSEHKLI